MRWKLLIPLAIALPIILLPVALIWWMQTGGMVQTVRERRYPDRTPGATG